MKKGPIVEIIAMKIYITKKITKIMLISHLQDLTFIMNMC